MIIIASERVRVVATPLLNRSMRLDAVSGSGGRRKAPAFGLNDGNVCPHAWLERGPGVKREQLVTSRDRVIPVDTGRSTPPHNTTQRNAHDKGSNRIGAWA